jgi:Tol biopolymer transport system component
MTVLRISIPALVTALSATSAHAQQRDTAWDVTLARGETRQIDFTTEEGTWMTVDVSPDGRWIYFDLLGHVYRVPSGGGDATSLTQNSGVAVNYQPAVSPDGRSVAFVSDRGGQLNLWVMDADGSNPRAVFHDLQVRVNAPAWTPDGQYIIVERRTLGGPTGAAGAGLWMYHRDGGQGIELVGRAARGAAWPSPSADGRFLYFHVPTPGETVPWVTAPEGARDDDGLARDILQGALQLRRLDLRTSEITPITSGSPSRQLRLSSGGAYAPQVSPDGRWLAFARRIPDGRIEWKGHEFGPRSALWLLDLETGRERLLMDPIEQDLAEGMKMLRLLPGYAWSRDGRSIVLSQGGKLRRLDVATGEVATIPFRARVQRTISEQAYAPFRIEDGDVEARFLRWHTGSSDGRRLAFQAFGRVWIMDLPDGAPRRLTPASFAPLEYAPAWSPDGRAVAFTSWDDPDGGHLWTVPAAGGEPRRITTEPGEYLNPAWTPDGRAIVVVRGAGAALRHSSYAHNPYYDIIVFPAAGGAGRAVARAAVPEEQSFFVTSRTQVVRPTVTADGRIHFQDIVTPAEGPAVMALVSVAADGSDRRELLTFPYADEIAPSPDGRRVAFNEGDNVYLAPVPTPAIGAQPLRIDKRRASVPVTTLSRQGGLYPRWRSDGVVEFGSGPSYYAHDVATGRTDTVRVRLRVPRALPSGTIALTNARLITLEDRQVVERGTLVVRGGRIACVGACDTAGADRVLDLSGKTVIPGFIDMHSHFFREYRGLFPKQMFETGVALAYGVTTNLDNSMWSQDVFPVAEMIEAGVVIGPRTFSTGDPLYAGDRHRQNELTSYQAAEDNVARLQSWGAVSIKQYMQPRRDQRQWVSHAARRLGLMVTAEGSDLPYNLSMIMDGQTGWEHPMPYVPMYGDVARFFGRAKAVYSITFSVGGPGPWNDEYFFQESDVWRDPKLRLWMPWRQLVPHARRRMLRPVTDYSYPILAQVLADIIAEGGHGAIGAHGQQHGLASHWEVWMAASAMGPMGALELASVHGAHFLGASEDLGTLRAGKLADLIVLNANPLDDIRSTTDIAYVMKGGTLYEGDTLDEVWPRQRPYGPRPWIDDVAWRDDVRSVHTWDRPARTDGPNRNGDRRDR